MTLSPPVGRFLLAASVLLGAVVLQTVVLARLGLPGATPDLLIVVVAAWALRRGPIEGAIIGFAGGALRDLAPPAVGPLGLWAITLAVIGFLVGLIADDVQRSSITPLVAVAVAGVLSILLYAGLSVIFVNDRVGWAAVGDQLLGQALYTVLLALIVLPPLSAGLRRFEVSGPRFA